MEHEINRLTDPKVVGPGTWWLTHMKAKDAVDDKSINSFIDHMKFLSENFSCKNCRMHIKQYMETHPFTDLINLKNEKGERIGMFKWAWMFHNAVNTRINKPYMEWETAVEMYYNDDIEICSKNCESAGNDHENSDHINHNKVNKEKDKVNEEKDKEQKNKERRYEDSTDDEKNIEKNTEKDAETDRKSKLAQGYFMSVGIKDTLRKNGINIPNRIQNEDVNISFVR